MPKIGSGLDKLKWPLVKKMLNSVFANSDIKITVYYLPKKQEDEFRKSLKSRKKLTATPSHTPKIFIAGDSNATGMARTIQDMAKTRVETFGVAKPGSGFKRIIEDVHNLALELALLDHLVIMGPSNDMPKVLQDKDFNPFKQEDINRIVSHAKSTNVTFVSIP